MDHFPRFRRKKDASGLTPSPGPDREDTDGKTTPPPGELVPNAPMRPPPKRSPFRVFHRGSGKRARDSPPASLPQSPVAVMHDGAAEQPASPESLRKDQAGEQETAVDKPLKIPAFLELSEQEIQARFLDLVWLERQRLMLSMANPSPDFRWARVSGQRIKHLDRYNNIQPWHNNRVKLRVPEGHLDYINASPIELSSSSPMPGREDDRYIAMQGPLPMSTDHVWRMIVEQLESPGVIIMLTETHEGSVEKCFQYFPRNVEDPPLEINRRDEFGDGFQATVHCEEIEETPAGDAIELRKLVIRVFPKTQSNGAGSGFGTPTANGRAGGTTAPGEGHGESGGATSKSPAIDGEDGAASGENGFAEPTTTSSSPVEGAHDPGAMDVEGSQPEERVVWHFLFKKWPDFGVPALEDIESFMTLMRLSREKNAHPHNPRIVHCSAGVGRSGTFIALEHLINELEAGVLEHYDERVAASPSLPQDSQHDDGSDSDERNGSSEIHESDGIQETEAAAPAGEFPATALLPGRAGEDDDLIFTTVNQLREQRRNMVQAESQYLFIYKVLRRLWQDRYGVEEVGEPAAKRLEVDPFLEERGK